MSHADHEWAQDLLAAHAAGSLAADERARLESHAEGCADCRAELESLRALDRSMGDLFATVRPQPGLEDRMIRALRAAPPKRTINRLWAVLPLSFAALLLVGLAFTVSQSKLGERTDPSYLAQTRANPAQTGYGDAPSDLRIDRTASAGGVVSGEKSVDELANAQAGDDVSSMIPRDPATDQQTASQIWKMAHIVQAQFGGRSKVLPTPENLESELRKMGADDLARDVYRFYGERGERIASLSEEEKEKRSAGLGHSTTRGFGSGIVRKDDFSPPPSAASVAAPMQESERLRSEVAGKKKEAYSSFQDAAPALKAETGRFKPGEAAKGPPVATPPMPESKVDKEGAEGRRVQDGNEPGVRPPPPPQEQPAVQQRKIIRSGDIEFEIESFDSTVTRIHAIAAEEGGFIATVNSEKLPNGKVRGTVVLRCPPGNLDTLILKLRALGDQKSQRIGSQDVTKLYTDMESRLRAALAMEERLIKIIKEGTGKIADLLAAEKELGNWRTQIEQLKGEINYYNNMISLSTLNITLNEKELRAPFGLIETERVQMGLEVEDVESAHKKALAAIADAKGLVTKSELKQLAAGQYNALVIFEVAPDAAGPIRDVFKQLGNVARLDVDRVQQTEGGTGKLQEIAKVKRNETQYTLSIYNLANVAPRETTHVNLACLDAEVAYKAILDRVEKAAGRVVSSNLSHLKIDQTSGTIVFEVKSTEAGAVRLDVRAAGEVMRLQVTENPDTQNVTRSKHGFNVQILALGAVAPRETAIVTLAAKEVPVAYQAILDTIRKAGARIHSSQLNENDRQNVTASIDFEARREHEKVIADAMAGAGDIVSRTATRAQDSENVSDSKFRFQLTLMNVTNIAPRETFTLGVEVADVEASVKAVKALAAELKGRTVIDRVSHAANGLSVGKIEIDVPLKAASAAVERISELGKRRVADAARNSQVPEGEFATARFQVTVSNRVLVPGGSGPWDRITDGFGVSMQALAWVVSMLVVAICVLGPISVVAWIVWKLYRKARPKPA